MKYEYGKSHEWAKIYMNSLECKALFLDRSNAIIEVSHFTKGSAKNTHANIPLLFTIALNCNANGFILLNNHPSGHM